MFDRSLLNIKSLFERRHDLDRSVINDINQRFPIIEDIPKGIQETSQRIIDAKKRSSSTIMMIGAHVIRSGVQNYLIDLMERGYITCLAMNGAGMIHDFEFAMVGATTESVARYIKDGRFGLWKETGILNDIIHENYQRNKHSNMGNVVGDAVTTGNFPYKELSLLAAGYQLKIPVTIHVGIGYDIIHELPNCDGAATGALSYNDFLRFASIVEKLEHGVVMNFGSAIMGPEIFLKALSMARNVAHPVGRDVRQFTALVCDLVELPENISSEPSKSNPAYYFRPWKTLLVRTVADGGESFYVKGNHADTIPQLWAAINNVEKGVSST